LRQELGNLVVNVCHIFIVILSDYGL
jgi:hypothetical protein